MKTIWDQKSRLDIQRRVEAVRDGMPPLWGTMSAGAMLRHLESSLKMTTGQLPVKRARLRVSFFPLKQLAIYVIPMPRGATTLPELRITSPVACEGTAREIERLLNDIVSTRDTTRWPEHPVFGHLSHRATGRLIWKHMDHHLRQFGV